MNIDRVQITIEPYKQAHMSQPPFVMLKVKIERWPGEEIHLEHVLPDDDLHSLWDYIWEAAGRDLRQAMETVIII